MEKVIVTTKSGTQIELEIQEWRLEDFNENEQIQPMQ